MIYFYLSANALVILLFVWLCSRKYGTILNPIGFFGGFYFISTVFAPFLFLQLNMFDDFSQESLERSSIYSSLYFLGLGGAFLVKVSPWKSLYNYLLRSISTDGVSRIAIVGQLGIFACAFLILAIASGVGSGWITNPREAYQYHRAGVGVWWSLAEAALMLAFICSLFRWAKTPLRLLALVICFGGLAGFL